jgi:endoglycosylceramidase
VLVAAALVATATVGCSSGDGSGSSRAAPADVDLLGGPGCRGTVESPDPRFVVDACGRVLILRGVNVESASKGTAMTDPHLPHTTRGQQAALADWGWNVVRFLVFWGAIEPEPGHYDEAYLDQVEDWVDWYGRRGIHVVLDLHQDLYSWKTHGNGAPDWAVDTRGLEVKPLPAGAPWYAQGADPGVQAAYQSFWNPLPGRPDLKASYLKALGHLAARFAKHPAVIGYDVMNEPSFANGDLDATLKLQADAAAGRFHNQNLTRFMQGGIDAIRAHDRDAWVMIEPTSLLNAFPYPGDLVADGIHDPRPGPPRLAYAGHLYEPTVHDGGGYQTDSTYVADWQRLRPAEATALHAALWFGEWGGDPGQGRMDQYVDEVGAMADSEMAGWAWWSWDPGGWSPVEADGRTLSANGERLLRVQPRAVAGVPTDFTWDPDERTFRLTWTDRDGVVGPTELAVPARLYPKGIDLVVDGQGIGDLHWDRKRSVLTVEVEQTFRTHQMCLAPQGAGTCR